MKAWRCVGSAKAFLTSLASFWHSCISEYSACIRSSLSLEIQSRGFSSPNSCVVPLSLWASLMAQMGKNLPAVQETQVQSLGQEDPQEKGIATHSSILVWRIPRTEERGGLQSMGSQRVRHVWATNNSNTLDSLPCCMHSWLETEADENLKDV